MIQIEPQRNLLKNEKSKGFDNFFIISQAIQYLINSSKSQKISFTCKTLKKRVREQSGIVLTGSNVRSCLYKLLPEYKIKIIRNGQKNRYFLDKPIF